MYIKKAFNGKKDSYKWENVGVRTYPQKELSGITRQTLVGQEKERANFEVRYYLFEAGSKGDYARHDREYFFYILHGKGQLRINAQFVNLEPNDMVYISPNELVQVVPQDGGSLGFLCVTTV